MSKTYVTSWEMRAKRVLAQESTGTNSKRASAYIQGVSPTHASRGEGCFFWDHQGNKYLDLVGSLGANLLGYRHPKVTEAVGKALMNGGPSFSIPHTLEVEVAEMICDMFPVECVRFMKNGNDATTAAVRIARAYGKGPKVLSSGYHGAGDIWTSLTQPALGVKDSFQICTENILNAIYVCEPVELDIGEDRKLRLTNMMKNADLTIFDEVITGCRVPKFSVAAWWNLRPDIMCLGKGLANGFPLSIVGGKKEIMNCGEYFLSSTFSGENIALAAAKATLEFIRANEVTDLWYYANRFMDRVNEIFKPLDIKIEGYGTRGMFPVDREKSAILMQECHKAGIFIGKAWFYGFAHMTSMNEEVTLNILSDVVSKIMAGRAKMEGKAPVQTFKR